MNPRNPFDEEVGVRPSQEISIHDIVTNNSCAIGTIYNDLNSILFFLNHTENKIDTVNDTPSCLYQELKIQNDALSDIVSLLDTIKANLGM